MNQAKMRYIQGLGWFIASLLTSALNDAITKQVGDTIDPWQVTFFRFFFGAATLLILILWQGKDLFVTHRWWLHAVRGSLICIAISLWSRGIQQAPIATATLVSFTVPIFVLLMAPLLLHERVTRPLWLATLIGFMGILYMLRPTVYSTNYGIMFFLVAACLFALLDILNKKYVDQEPLFSTLFYTSLTAAVLSIYPAIRVWTTPNVATWISLLALGIGSNLILYCLLRAFTYANASWLAPFRYVELFLSTAIGYLCFDELPPMSHLLGAIFIIPATLFIAYYQLRD